MSTHGFTVSPDELAPNEVAVAAGNTASDAYHTRECKRYPGKPKAMDRTVAEAWGRDKCAMCKEIEDDD